jgi:hypothetical protein
MTQYPPSSFVDYASLSSPKHFIPHQDRDSVHPHVDAITASISNIDLKHKSISAGQTDWKEIFG